MTLLSHNKIIPDPKPIGSYRADDCIFLLKDLSNQIEEKGTSEREAAIQSGTHYSEMLPIEYRPTKKYLDLFHQMLQQSARKVALAVGTVAELILHNRGEKIVIASLARAGTPIGVLIKRYLAAVHQLNLPHYSISIIRGKGFDTNAILYMLQQHPEREIQFIDGWTGKGAITKVLNEACQEMKSRFGIELNSDLAVLADPGHCVQTFGTREDFLIPSACLNATVSGLVSRTVHHPDLIGESDFHGAKYYKEWKNEDLSYLFIDTISAFWNDIYKEAAERAEKIKNQSCKATWQGLKSIKWIQEEYNIDDINLIKPGVGETTRVLLRRIPWKILVDDLNNPNLAHILLLAEERGVPVKEVKGLTYSCCGLIKPIKTHIS